jgi:hypothetical protein
VTRGTVTRAHCEVVVPLSLPANQTVENVLLLDDLFTTFQVVGEGEQSYLDSVMENWSLYLNSFQHMDFPHFDARLTIRMGVNTKCGEQGSRALFYHVERVPLLIRED